MLQLLKSLRGPLVLCYFPHNIHTVSISMQSVQASSVWTVNKMEIMHHNPFCEHWSIIGFPTALCKAGFASTLTNQVCLDLCHGFLFLCTVNSNHHPNCHGWSDMAKRLKGTVFSLSYVVYRLSSEA